MSLTVGMVYRIKRLRPGARNPTCTGRLIRETPENYHFLVAPHAVRFVSKSPEKLFEIRRYFSGQTEEGFI